MEKVVFNKYFVITLLTISSIYTCWYMSFGNITKNSGALSTIGLKHPLLFLIWGILTYLSLLVGISKMYNDFKPKYNFNKIIIPFATLGMVLTLFCDFDFDKKVQYFAHCIGSIGFTVLFATLLLIFFINFYKKALIFRVFAYLVVAIMITSLVFLLIFKETSLLEVAPMFSSYVIIILVNCTNLFKAKELSNA